MNKHISQFNWSNKTNTKLINLGINTIEDFNGISIKALEEVGIPKTVIKQITDICKVHNIMIKNIELKIYRVKAISRTRSYIYDKFIDFIAYTPQEAKTMMIEYLTKHNCIEEYKDNIAVVDDVDIKYGVNITDM